MRGCMAALVWREKMPHGRSQHTYWSKVNLLPAPLYLKCHDFVYFLGVTDGILSDLLFFLM